MSHSDVTSVIPDPNRHPVDLLAEDFAAKCRRGEHPSVAEYARNHPEHADQLREVLPPIAMMERLKARNLSASGSGGSASAPLVLERLGDFRIIREIGRGGMGIVYEALQESLGRSVALKVLSRASLLDPQRIDRFEREARAAAALHHTNIVQVFGVGQAEGLRYIAMQQISGRPLNEVIRQLGQDSGGHPGDPSMRHAAKSAASAQLPPPVLRGRDGEGAPASDVSKSRSSDARKSRSTSSVRAPSLTLPRSTGGGDKANTVSGIGVVQPLSGEIPNGSAYWRWVALLGHQVADALDYAHSRNVIHRDIKPANLLLDERGIVWVTDFGLAKQAEAANVTRSGDVVGTLQYMAPEGLKSQTDARGDVYGLGITLYELLVLKPAYEAPSLPALMRKIGETDPIRPRKLNPHIPADLETIVMKAIARQPEQRYASAAALAEDLANFASDRPIAARRTSIIEHAWRWCRRNRAVAALTFIALLAGIAAIIAGWSAYGVTRKALADEATRRKEIETAKKRADDNVALSLAGFEEIFNRLAPLDDRGPPGPWQPDPNMRGGPPGRGGPGNQIDTSTDNEAALLGAILTFYDKFAKENPTNEALRAEAARAYRRVGDSYLRLRKPTDADVAFRRSTAIYTDLLKAVPDSAAYKLGLAESVTWLDTEQTTVPPADQEVIHRATSIAEKWYASATTSPDEGEIVARVVWRDGECWRQIGQNGEAEKRFIRAIGVWDGIAPTKHNNGRRRNGGPGDGPPDDPGPPEDRGFPPDQRGGPPGQGGEDRPPPGHADRFLPSLSLAEIRVAAGRKQDAKEPLKNALLMLQVNDRGPRDSARFASAYERIAKAATAIGDDDLATRARQAGMYRQGDPRRGGPGGGGPGGGRPPFDDPEGRGGGGRPPPPPPGPP
jgi:serine/threonine protein kinase